MNNMNNSYPVGSSGRTARLYSSNPLLKSCKTYGFAIAIIIGIGGLAVGGVGAAGYFGGAISNLNQVHAIIMMAAGGGGGAILFIVGVVGTVKKCRNNLSFGLPSSHSADRETYQNQVPVTSSTQIDNKDKDNDTTRSSSPQPGSSSFGLPSSQPGSSIKNGNIYSFQTEKQISSKTLPLEQSPHYFGCISGKQAEVLLKASDSKHIWLLRYSNTKQDFCISAKEANGNIGHCFLKKLQLQGFLKDLKLQEIKISAILKAINKTYETECTFQNALIHPKFGTPPFCLEDELTPSSAIYPPRKAVKPPKVDITTYEEWLFKRDFIGDDFELIKKNKSECDKFEGEYKKHIKFEYTDEKCTIYWYCTRHVYSAILAKENIQNPNSPINKILNKGPDDKREKSCDQGKIYIPLNKEERKTNLEKNPNFREATDALTEKSFYALQPKENENDWHAKVLSEQRLDDALKKYLNSYRGICFGECHDESAPKTVLKNMMQSFADQGVKFLFLEHLFWDADQDLLDDYFENPNNRMDPLLKHRLISITREQNIQYVKLVKCAVECGIQVVAIDTSLSYACGFNFASGSAGVARMSAMNLTAKIIMDAYLAVDDSAKFVALVGSAHVGRFTEEMKDSRKTVKGVGELMETPAVIIKEGNGLQTPQIKYGVEIFDKRERPFSYLTDELSNIDAVIEV